MLIVIAALIWPAIGFFTHLDDPYLWQSFINNWFSLGVWSLVTVVVVTFITDFTAWGFGTPLACVAVFFDVVMLVGGFFMNGYGTGIINWVKDNGLFRNTMIVLFLILTVYANWKGKRRPKLTQMGIGKFLPFLLFVPTLILYTFNGFPGLDGWLEEWFRAPFSEWQWANKLSLICFVFCLTKRFLIEVMCGRKAYAWKFIAFCGNLSIVTFAFLVLERFLYREFTGFLFGTIVHLGLFALEMFFQFYSYLYILYSVINFFAPGAITEWRMAREARDLARARDPRVQARKKYEEKLDARERATNAAVGRGPYTDEEAFIQGKESADEYAAGSILRDQKLNKYDSR